MNSDILKAFYKFFVTAIDISKKDRNRKTRTTHKYLNGEYGHPRIHRHKYFWVQV